MALHQVKVCLITGATSGIGRAAALALAQTRVRLFLTGRSTHRGRRVVQACRRAGGGIEVEFIPADLGCRRDVRKLAEAVRSRVSFLNVLVNNAGARFDRYEETEDGVERTFATNHLGHFLLTVLLLDCLLAAPTGRVVVTGSSAHAGAPAGGNWCLSAEGWNRSAAYAKSKLANIMFAYELARRTAGTAVTSNAMDPGGVATRFASNNGLKAWLRHLGYYALNGQLIGPRKGADTIVHLATDESLRGCSGGYYKQRTEIRSSPASYDELAARRLWELSRVQTELGTSLDGLSEQAHRIVAG